MNGVSATFFVFGAWTCMLLVDRIGRRPLFLHTSLHLVVWFSIMAVFTSGVVQAHTSQIMVIICGVVFMFIFGLAWAPVAWLCKYCLRMSASCFIFIRYSRSYVSTCQLNRCFWDLSLACQSTRHGIGFADTMGKDMSFNDSTFHLMDMVSL